MCSLPLGSALPWSTEDLAGPLIAVIVIGAIILWLLIGVISAWLASKVLVSDRDTTFSAALVVCIFHFVAGIGMGIFHIILVFVMGAQSDGEIGTLIAFLLFVLAVVLNILITGRIYGIGALHAFGFNLLGGFFTLLICGLVCVAVLVVGGIGIGAARAKLQATAEQVAHGGTSIMQPSPPPTPPPDLSPEIDALLEAALHPPGPPPPLAEREATVRQLQEKLQTQRNNLPLNDAYAVAAYQNRLKRYLLLLNTVKAERQAQTARDSTASRHSVPGAAQPH